MWRLIFTLLLLLFFDGIHTQKVNNNIQNEDVISLIDITSSIVKNVYKILFKNVGATPVETYLFELREAEALVTFTNNVNEKLQYKTISTKNFTTYIINLDKRLLQNEEYRLEIHTIFPSKLEPATKFSRYNEEHSFMWKANRLFYSQYYTVNYRCLFLTNPSFNRNIESSVAYYSTGENMITFHERYIEPHSYDELILTFTTPTPVLKVKKLDRSIFVSTYGKILVQDQIVVENAGPKLKGPYFNNQTEYWMFTHLPSSAGSVALSDIIGDNFKTNLYENNGSKTLKFIPRYSLRQGGWKSTYILQYDVPVYEYIFQDNYHYYLKIRAMDHILNDVMVEEADVNIILPDCASIVQVAVPLGFEKRNSTNIYTSLSVLGRPMINLRGKLLVEEHINDVIVKYSFSLFSFLSVPFYLVFMLETIFLLIIVLRK